MTNRSLRALLHLLTEPKASIPESGRRRARLLAWIQLAILALSAAAVPIILVFSTSQGPGLSRYGGLLAGVVLLLAVAYPLNRAGRYHASAWLTIAATTAGSWAAVALSSSAFNGDLIPLTFVVLPIFLASSLLSTAATALLAVVQIGLLIMIKLLYPGQTPGNWPSLVTFVVFVSVLNVLAAVVSRKDLEQIERQSVLLLKNEVILREQSVRDVLTGLFNRRYLEETLEREVSRARRAHYPLGVMMVDIDHFKHFNDAYGHALGDEVLRQLGALLSANVRGSDIACRYGGEEFIVLLPEATAEVTRARAEHIRQGASRLSLRHEGRAIEPVTLSIGLASFAQDDALGAALLKSADDALYCAKRAGRDRIAAAD